MLRNDAEDLGDLRPQRFDVPVVVDYMMSNFSLQVKWHLGIFSARKFIRCPAPTRLNALKTNRKRSINHYESVALALHIGFEQERRIDDQSLYGRGCLRKQRTSLSVNPRMNEALETLALSICRRAISVRCADSRKNLCCNSTAINVSLWVENRCAPPLHDFFAHRWVFECFACKCV